MLRRSLLVVVLLLTLVSSLVGGVYTSFADDAIGRGDGLLFGFHHHHDIGDPESEASDESLMHQVLDHASLTPTMCSVYTLVCGALCFDRRNSPPSAVLDDGAELQAATSTTCWSSAKEIRHARPSQ